jgi:hypothetical protein
MSLRTELHAVPGAEKGSYERFWTSLGPHDGRVYYVTWTGAISRKDEPRVAIMSVGSDPSDIQRTEVSLQQSDKLLQTKSVSLSGGYINLFTTFNNKRTNKSYLLLHRIDAKTLEAPEEPTVMMSLDGATNRDGNYWSFTNPKDNEGGHVIEYRVDKPGKRIDVHFLVLNSRLEKRYEHVVEDVDKEAYGRMYVIGATSEGYLYYVNAEGGDTRRLASSPGQRYLNVVKPDGSEKKQRIRTTGQTEPTAPHVTFDPQGNLVAAGTYYDPAIKGYGGLYLMKFSPESLAPIHQRMIPLALTENGLFEHGNKGEKYDKKARELMDASQVREILFTESGATYLLTQFRIGMQYVSRAGSVYYFDHQRGYIVSRIAADGSLSYLRHVPTSIATSMSSPVPRWAERPHGTVIGDSLLVSFYGSTEQIDNFTERIKGKPEDSARKIVLRHLLFEPNGDYHAGTNRQFSERNYKDSFIPGSGSLISGADAIHYLALVRGGKLTVASVTIPGDNRSR